MAADPSRGHPSVAGHWPGVSAAYTGDLRQATARQTAKRRLQSRYWRWHRCTVLPTLMRCAGERLP